MTVLKNCEFSRCVGHDLPYFERSLFASCQILFYFLVITVWTVILTYYLGRSFEIQWDGVGEGRQNLSGLTLPVREELKRMNNSWTRNWRVICTVMYNTPFLAEISAVETNMKTNLCDPLLLVKFSIFLVSIKTVTFYFQFFILLVGYFLFAYCFSCS